jgi:hypothetical protein
MQRWPLLLSLLLLIWFALSGPALADTYDMIDPRLQKSSKPMTFQLEFGGAFGLFNLPSQFKLSEVFTIHLMGKHDGFFVGLQADQSVSPGQFILQVRPLAGYAIRLIDKLALFLVPQLQAGFSLSIDNVGPQMFFNLQAALEVQLILDDRWIFSFKPLVMDLSFGSVQVMGRIDLLFGAGFKF